MKPEFCFGITGLTIAGFFSANIHSGAHSLDLRDKLTPPAPPRFYSTDAVIAAYGKSVREKLKAEFARQKVSYPPKKLTWIVLKAERQLLIFARNNKGLICRILSYPIIGASGRAGPKLAEGDKQVPEGFYRLTGFRPNLVAHIGLDVNYPNQFDHARARAEKRQNLGGEILIHGSKWSTGCLAMGNEPIEEMFVLAYDCGLENITLLFAPCNLNSNKPEIDFKKQPSWLPQLYRQLALELGRYPL